MENIRVILRPAISAYMFIVLPILVIELIVAVGLFKVGNFDLVALFCFIFIFLVVFWLVAFNRLSLSGDCLSARSPFTRQDCSVNGRLIEIGFRGRADNGRGTLNSVGFFISVKDEVSREILLEKNLKLFSRNDIKRLVNGLMAAGGIVDIDRASEYFIKLGKI